jgi:hypothetical protein
MKKKVLIGVALFGVLAFTAEKKFTIVLNEKQANRMFTDLANIQVIVDRSSLPHDQAKYIVASIDSIKADIAPQISKQLDSTGKK